MQWIVRSLQPLHTRHFFLSTESIITRSIFISPSLFRSLPSSMVNNTSRKPEPSDGVEHAELTNDNISSIYEKALEYWSSIACNVDGMLGGFAQLHLPDVGASRLFIAHLRNSKLLLDNERALDCGCGIGRVTKHLLLPAFRSVDMIDFAETFLLNSRRYIGDEAFKRIGEQFVDSLHTFEPHARHYNLIWVQWVSGQLTDTDLIAFLRRCKLALKPGGCVVVKDNIAAGSRSDFDASDQSWTRPLDAFHAIFRRARLDVVAERRQTNFPKGIYEVRMFALRPSAANDPDFDDDKQWIDEPDDGDETQFGDVDRAANENKGIGGDDRPKESGKTTNGSSLY